jgi:hypothetical protein
MRQKERDKRAVRILWAVIGWPWRQRTTRPTMCWLSRDDVLAVA